MQALNNLVDYKSTADIFEKVLQASYAVESLDRNKERGSASCERKEQSLLGRWYEKYEPQSNKDINMHERVNDIFIEINTLVSSNIQIKSGKSKLMITND